MATIKVLVRKEKGKIKVNSKGETLIFVQYGHMGKTVLFSTSVRVDPSCLKWNKKDLDQREPIKKSLHGYTTKNSNIRKVANEIDSIKDKLINQDIIPTIEEVKRAYEEKHKPAEVKKDFFTLFTEFIESPGNRAHATIKSYKVLMNNLKSFQTSTGFKISVDNIDLKFYDRLVHYYLKEHKLPGKEEPGKAKKIGMTPNAVGNQIKLLKAFLKHIELRGYELKVNLSDLKATKIPPPILYLSQEELEQLHKHDFSECPRLEKVRDLFSLQCATGLRVSDLVRLGKEHIYGNIIKMKAHKTRKDVIVPLTPISDEILRKYNYELPLISDQKFNLYIKECCQEAGIASKVEICEFRNGQKLYRKYFKHELVSTHTAVKTFITHCAEKGISAKVVSEITGKTVKIILDHYYGTNDKVIELEMQKAFGSPDAPLKIAK